MRGRNRDDDAGPSGSGKRRKGVGDSGLQEANGSDSGRKKRCAFQQDKERSSEQAPKKSKIFVRGGDGFCPGNIVEIELHNFMTYDHIQARPGPRLNLITGPNGSGKSTIVCSICIGLGGNPKVLGRQKDVGDFVKRGQEHGSVRLKLRGDTEDDTIDITRKIFKDNKSEWSLDGRACKKEDIANVVEKYNCQIDNLTQFLPQDKVCEFARLTSIELLLETEKAVGDPGLPAMHSQLILAMKVISELANKVKSQTETLAVLERENADLAIDVARINQRNELLETVSFMKLKLPWIVYDTAQKAYLSNKRELKELKEDAQRAKEEYLAAAAPLEEAKARLKKTDGKGKQEHEKLKALDRKQGDSVDAEDKAARDASDVILKMNNAVSKANKLGRDIEKSMMEVAGAEADLQSIVVEEVPVDTEGEYAAKMEGLRHTISGFLAEKETLDHKLPQVMQEMERCHHKLNAAKDSRYHVEQALMRGSQKLRSALDTVEEHRANDAFRGNVYGPIAAEVYKEMVYNILWNEICGWNRELVE